MADITEKESREQSVSSNNATAVTEAVPDALTYQDPKAAAADPIVMIAVVLKEAALDSPSFQASMNHINEQLESLDRWLDALAKAIVKMSQEMDSLQDAANFITSKFLPEFVTRGIIDHDHTMLAMRRYAEATRQYFASIIKKVKSDSAKTLKIIAAFRAAQMRSYKEARKNFESAQYRYESALIRYLAVSKNKEPSAIREDAFQLSELKRHYIKSCFDLCCIIFTVESAANQSLISALVDPWDVHAELALSDPIFTRIAIEMHRVKAWSREMQKALKPIEAEMLQVRNSTEEATINRSTPSRDLHDYTLESSVLHQFTPQDFSGGLSEKHGWLFVKGYVKPSRQVWVRRWAFVKNGMFGWLMLSPNKTFVQETDKIGVLLCNVSPEPNEDRRFCFEIRTKNSTLVLQAESLAELKSWLQVFETAKREVLQANPQSDVNAAFQNIYPMVPAFASSSNVSADTEFTHDHLTGSHSRSASDTAAPRDLNTDNKSDLLTSPTSATLQELINSCRTDVQESLILAMKNELSSLGPFGSVLAPLTFLNLPMPTSMSLQAVISNGFVTPSEIPSAIVANYWGSINWAQYQNKSRNRTGGKILLDTAPKIPQLCPKAPAFYSNILLSQDMQLRAIFQGLVDDNPLDRVVLTFRALVKAGVNKELPSRIFVTPVNLYLYSQAFGFVIVRKMSLKTLVGIEGFANTSWDTLYLSGGPAATSCRVFLDSGTLLKKRLNFLLNNASSETPLDLETIISRLEEIGDSRMKKLKDSIDDVADTEVSDTGGDEKSSLVHGVLYKYLTGKPLKSKATVPRELDLSFTMDKVISKRDYDLPARGLFHLMFGEKSDVFLFEDVGLYARTDARTTPWRIADSNRPEREISYLLRPKGVFLMSSTMERVVNVQKVEKRIDNSSYVVYDRRSPRLLPNGYSCYAASRYIITQVGRSHSRLVILGSVEWIKSSSMIRGVVDSILYHQLAVESKVIHSRILENKKKLGSRGLSNAAINVFGKLGTSEEEVISGHQSSEAKKLSDELKLITEQTTQVPLAVTRLKLVVAFLMVCLSVIVSPIVLSFRYIGRIGSSMFKEFTVNRLLAICLIVSLGTNAVLSGRIVSSFFSQNNAIRLAETMHIVPRLDGANMKRSIYLKDLDELVAFGKEEISGNPSGPCYSKFKDIFIESTLDAFDDLVPRGSSTDANSIETKNRIHELQLEAATRRNDLLLQLRVLNYMEKQSIITEYQKWLVHELTYCSEYSATLTGNSDEIIHLQQYCSSCIDDWNSSSRALL